MTDAISDFESKSDMFTAPAGTGYQNNTVVTKRSSPNMAGQLSDDVMRLKDFMTTAIRAGDTDRANQAYRQISMFTEGNHEALGKIAQLAYSEGPTAVLGKRAQSLLDRTFISDDDLRGLDPLENKRAPGFFQAKTQANSIAADLHMKQMSGKISVYDQDIYAFAEGMAAVRKTVTSTAQGGLTVNTPVIDHYDFSQRANDFLTFATNAKSLIQGLAGKDDLPDDQVRKLAGLVKSSYIMGNSNMSRLSVLNAMSESNEKDPTRKSQQLADTGEGLLRVLSATDSGTLDAIGYVAKTVSGEALIKQYKAMVKSGGDANQVQRDFSQVLSTFTGRGKRYDLEVNPELRDVMTELAVKEAVGSRSVTRDLSGHALGVLSAEGALNEHQNKMGEIDQNGKVKKSYTAPELELVAPVTRDVESLVMKQIVAGKLNGSDVAGTLEKLYRGDVTDASSNYVELQDGFNRALDAQVLAIHNEVPSLPIDQIRIGVQSMLSGKALAAVSQKDAWENSVSEVNLLQRFNDTMSAQDPQSVSLIAEQASGITAVLARPSMVDKSTGKIIPGFIDKLTEEEKADLPLVMARLSEMGVPRTGHEGAEFELGRQFAEKFKENPELKQALTVLQASGNMPQEKKVWASRAAQIITRELLDNVPGWAKFKPEKDSTKRSPEWFGRIKGSGYVDSVEADITRHLIDGRSVDMSVIAREYGAHAAGVALNPFGVSKVRAPAAGSVAEREILIAIKFVNGISTRLLKEQKANTDALDQMKATGETQAYEAYSRATRRAINKESRDALMAQATDMARNPKYSAEERSLGRRAQSLISDIDTNDSKAVLSFPQLLVMAELYDKQQKAKAGRAGSEEAALAADMKRKIAGDKGMVYHPKIGEESPAAPDAPVAP